MICISGSGAQENNLLIVTNISFTMQWTVLILWMMPRAYVLISPSSFVMKSIVLLLYEAAP